MKRKYITFGRIIRTGVINFFRNASLAAAAIVVMVVTLSIVLLSLVVNTTLTGTINQITDRIDVSVYLVDDISMSEREQLIDDLEALPNVGGVTYLSKEDALNTYKRDNAGNPELLAAISQTDNPLPATIRIKPIDLNKVQDIQNYLEQDEVAALQSEEPSYSGDRKEAIDKISHAANVLRQVGVGGMIMFGLISVLIIFNTIQMAIFNRRDEISIMRLLGASTGFIRGPFVVEGVIYGVISGLLSMLIMKSLFLAASDALQASSLGLLDIAYAQQYFQQNFWWLLTMQLGIGIVIGAASSVIATRRYLKFKTTKK